MRLLWGWHNSVLPGLTVKMYQKVIRLPWKELQSESDTWWLLTMLKHCFPCTDQCHVLRLLISLHSISDKYATTNVLFEFRKQIEELCHQVWWTQKQYDTFGHSDLSYVSSKMTCARRCRQHFSLVAFLAGVLLRNDPACVGWGVKLYCKSSSAGALLLTVASRHWYNLHELPWLENRSFPLFTLVLHWFFSRYCSFRSSASLKLLSGWELFDPSSWRGSNVYRVLIEQMFIQTVV